MMAEGGIENKQKKNPHTPFQYTYPKSIWIFIYHSVQFNDFGILCAGTEKERDKYTEGETNRVYT